jgi:hypothetical protein
MSSDAIVIPIKLAPQDIPVAGAEIARQLGKALDAGAGLAKEAGRKIAQALNTGIEAGLRDAARLRAQLDAALSPDRRHAAFEAKERVHQQRLEAIARVSAAQLQAIETRKQAQLDLIRERGTQKELEHQRKLERAAQQSAGGVGSLRSAIAGVQGAFAALAAVGIVSLFERLGRAALDAAIDIDKQVNTLKALTGSAQAAEQRFAALIALAQKTPGLTTSLAATLDAQLRILDVTEQTINKILPAIGRLNAGSPLGDPQQFASNLGQLISQGFERQDLKELVGQSPLAGQLIKEIFGVNNPTNAAAIRAAARKLGIDTAEELFTAFAQAAENNQALRSVTEGLGTQFEKLRDRLSVALAPVGEQIAKTLLPVFDDLVQSVEKFGASAAQTFRDNKNDIIAAAKQVGILVVEIGKLTVALGELAVKSQIPEFLGRAAAESQDILNDPIGQLFSFNKGPKLLEFERELARIEAERKLPRLSTEPGVTSGLIETMKAIADFRSASGGRRNRGGGDDGGSSDRQRQKTELEKAIKDVDELTRQVGALRAGTGKLFQEELKLFQAQIDRERLEDERKQLRFIRAKIARGEAFAPQLPGGIGLPTLPLTAAGNPAGIAGRPTITFQSDIDAETADVNRRRAEIQNQQLRIQEVQIQNQVNRGLLSEAEAQRQLAVARRAARDEILATLEAQLEAVGANTIEGLQILEQIERTKTLGLELSNAERFMRGFGRATETVGDAFERLGENVSRALTNTKDLLGSLKQAVLQFFNDLLGQQLQGLLRSVFAPIAGALGGLNPAAAGGIGGIFRTPSTFPTNAFQGIASALSGGGGVSAPPSITSSIGSFIGAGVPRTAGVVRGGIEEFVGAGVPRAVGKINFSFGALGKSIGQSLGAAAPFLGASLGGSLGGQSVLGQILGTGGGFLGGGAVAAAIPGVLSPAAAAFFTNPFTIAIGAGLLIGSVLLGKAKQRKQDEEASGQMLTQALSGIEQLATAISTDQVEGAQARGIFDTQILGVFKQQISGLKTKSVVESRLKNQVRDLENVYQDRITPLIAAQAERRRQGLQAAAIDRRLIPQFAIGGIVPGRDVGRDSVLSLLRPGEMVLTREHQAVIRALAGPDVFNRVGVPGAGQQVGPAQAFQFGGVAQIQPASFAPAAPATIVIDTLVIGYGMSKSGAEEIFIAGGSGRNGENLVINHIQNARTRGRQV